MFLFLFFVFVFVFVFFFFVSLRSLPRCIAWLALFGIEFVATVTMDAFSVIVYLKEPRLSKRSMCLVISPGAADVFVGGFVLFFRLKDFEKYCLLWKTNLSRRVATIFFALKRFFIVASVTRLFCYFEWSTCTPPFVQLSIVSWSSTSGSLGRLLEPFGPLPLC